MKIGVLTFHNAINYGAVLQTLATQELLKSRGHYVEIIDYRNTAIEDYYKKFEFSYKKLLTLNPIKFIKNIFVPFLYKKRLLRYKDFLVHLNLSDRINCGDYIAKYDAIFVGSDQVWSKKHTGGFDDMYWGNFPTQVHTKKIAWSVCAGDADINIKDNQIREYLQNFSHISVRENSLKNRLLQISNMDVAVTLDPTLAVDGHVWEQFCHPIKSEDYILVYSVKHLQATLKIAKLLGKLLRKKVIVVAAYPGSPVGLNVEYSCGPQDFLSYIKHASFVVTSSFHGTVFSLLFQKEFVSIIPNGEKNIRVDEILQSVGLSDRIAHNEHDIKKYSKIDYNVVNSRLENLKRDTLNFLSTIGA